MRTLAIVVGLVVAVALLWSVTSDQGSQTGDLIKYQRGQRFDRDGWIYLSIKGKPYERGMQHGYLVAPELKEILKTAKYMIYWDTGKKWEFFVDAAVKLWADRIPRELIEEMKGIAAGARAAGVEITWQDVLTWNGYEELTDYWWPNAIDKDRYAPRIPARRDHCSAFIATGDATEDGRIVMAHNTWNEFVMGQFSNVILEIKPDKGHRMFMQAAPGYIDSFADFFVTDAGIMGTETTIGGFSMYDENEVPEFVRVRMAMQYADNIDRFIERMKKQNNGGYANSWLLGDIKTGEIVRLELGLRFSAVTRKKNGFFVGFNAPIDPRIRNLECSNTGYADIRRHQGARQVRLTQLMRKNYGRIDVELGKEILADHYDVYLKKENPCSRTVDGHYELDPRQYMSDPSRPKPFQPRGTMDGKVMDSDMAEEMSFWARWGNSSGMAFSAREFLAEHIQWEYLKGYLQDRPTRPWSRFTAD